MYAPLSTCSSPLTATVMLPPLSEEDVSDDMIGAAGALSAGVEGKRSGCYGYVAPGSEAVVGFRADVAAVADGQSARDVDRHAAGVSGADVADAGIRGVRGNERVLSGASIDDQIGRRHRHAAAVARAECVGGYVRAVFNPQVAWRRYVDASAAAAAKRIGSDETGLVPSRAGVDQDVRAAHRDRSGIAGHIVGFGADIAAILDHDVPGDLYSHRTRVAGADGSGDAEGRLGRDEGVLRIAAVDQQAAGRYCYAAAIARPNRIGGYVGAVTNGQVARHRNIDTTAVPGAGGTGTDKAIAVLGRAGVELDTRATYGDRSGVSGCVIGV